MLGLVGQSDQVAQRVWIGLLAGSAGSAAGQKQSAIDLAAPDLRADPFAQQALQRAQFLGHPELHVEETRIDGAQLKAEFAAR